jgi:hypothetical protein
MKAPNPPARFQRGCGPVKFAGEGGARDERHLTIDQMVPGSQTTARDKFSSDRTIAEYAQEGRQVEPCLPEL